ncbi:MAG: phosphatidylcholine synthase [Hyphomicrobium sp.]|nr:phosphatidylcholine synthase [Hyphomicrobium sp.]
MRVLPALVHIFTALGAVCGLLATQAILTGDASRLFAWLAIALVIDAIDGTFARAVRVSEQLPRFSGERLDLVVDYVTYVFVPVLALLQWRYLDGSLGLVLAAGILLSSLFHFSDLESKTKDNCFVGFPAIWNIFAFYVFALDPAAWVAQLAVALAIVATFVPMPWVHPLRVVALRPLTLVVTALAGAGGIAVLLSGFPAPPLWQAALIAAALYYTALAFYWWRKGVAS